MATAKAWTNAAFRARALVELGTLSEAPTWLEAIERFGAHEPKAGRAPKQIHFDEDRLYQAYIHKHPEFRQQPVDLNSENPSAIKLFVLTQAALIEQGHSRKAAYDVVESEFQKAMTGSDQRSAVQTALSAAQNEEEAILQEALRLRREQFGPPANLEPAPVSQQPFSFRQPPPQAKPAAASNVNSKSAAAGNSNPQDRSKTSRQEPRPKQTAAQDRSKTSPPEPQPKQTAAGQAKREPRSKRSAADEAEQEPQTRREPISWVSLTKPPAAGSKPVDSAGSPASEPLQQAPPAGFVQLGEKPEGPQSQ